MIEPRVKPNLSDSTSSTSPLLTNALPDISYLPHIHSWIQRKPETHQLSCVSILRLPPPGWPSPKTLLEGKSSLPQAASWPQLWFRRLSNFCWDFLFSYYFFPGWGQSRLSTLCFGNLQHTWKDKKSFFYISRRGDPVTLGETMSVGLNLELSGPCLPPQLSALPLPHHHNHPLIHSWFIKKVRILQIASWSLLLWITQPPWVNFEITKFSFKSSCFMASQVMILSFHLTPGWPNPPLWAWDANQERPGFREVQTGKSQWT